MAIHLEFNPDTLSILNDERHSHPVPLVQRRMEALWLKNHDLPHAQIAKLVGVCENTLRDYFELYQQVGVENLRTINFHRPVSELCTHISSLEAYFKGHQPARSPTQVATFLKKNSNYKVSAPYFLLMLRISCWPPFFGFLWSVTRLFIRAPAGRQRFNILGTLEARYWDQRKKSLMRSSLRE